MQTWTLRTAQQLCAQLDKVFSRNITRIVESRIGSIVVIADGLDILATLDCFGLHPAEGCPIEVRMALQQVVQEKTTR